ncbi:MAG: peptidylprolyl isomerase [Lewinellaceae bacterium]|nr:peptidylprolyl isomerase [Lewinellaceae bacterium]
MTYRNPNYGFWIGLLLLSMVFLGGCHRSGDRYAMIYTRLGDIKIKLYGATPQHRDNFIRLVEMGFYDSLLFHQVVRDFIIQGGDPASRNATSSATLGLNPPAFTIPAEIGAPALRGAIGAARQGNSLNPEKASDGTQFFIVQGSAQTEAALDEVARVSGLNFSPELRKAYLEKGGAPKLEGEYTIFGEVVSGLEVIDKIGGLPRDINDRPLQDLHMLIRLVQQ